MSDSLIDALFSAGARHPEAAAIIHRGSVITHRQLRGLIHAAARELWQRGVRPGMNVGLTMAQTPLHCVTMLALARLGALSVPLFPSQTPDQSHAMIARYGLVAIISDRNMDLPEAIAHIRLDGVSSDGRIAEFDADGFWPGSDTPLSVALTSGTTGFSKGILRTHGFLLARMANNTMPRGPGSRMIPPDLHQTVAQTYALSVLCAGGCLVFPRSYALRDMIGDLALYGVSHILLSPAKAAQMVDLLPDDAGAFPCLTHLRIMGGRPSRSLLDRLSRRMSPEIHIPYGSTEIGVITMATPETLAIDPDSAGYVTPWAQLEIVDGDDTPVATGESGEIRFRAEVMPESFYRDEQASSIRFRNGWFYPGDRGRIEGSGLVYVEGRTDNILNLGGHKVTAEFIEATLERHPSVAEAFVFAVDDGGEMPSLVAAVVPGASLDIPVLEAWCRGALGVMSPREFLAMTDIPRTETGKVKRPELLALVLARRVATPGGTG